MPKLRLLSLIVTIMKYIYVSPDNPKFKIDLLAKPMT